MEVIKDILIEVRSRLRSCNVVLLTQTDFDENYHLKVSVRPNFIIVNYTDYNYKMKKKKSTHTLSRRDSTSSCESYSDSEEENYGYSKFIDVTSHCKLLPSSLTSLKIESEYISFRVLTEPNEPSSSGTFFNEIINKNEIFDNSNFKSVLSINKCLLESPKSENNLILYCSNCLHIISHNNNGNSMLINRILELPSDNLDMSDWFCHKHTANDCNSTEAQSKNNRGFVPGTNDIFYGLCYFFINIVNMSPSIIKFNFVRHVVYCDRCFSWLGIKHAETFKLWNSCIKIDKFENTNNNNKFNLLGFSVKCSNDVTLDNFLQIIKHGISVSFVSAISTVCKLLLECQFNDNKKQYILIWIMDKQLDILKADHKCLKNVNENKHEIKLNHISTSKLLFKVDDDLDLIKRWSEDSAVQSFEISKTMFIEGKKHLQKMSNYIPHSFKKTNDFSVTYLQI